MSKLIYGLDFGTTNSAIAVYHDGDVTMVPVDPLGNEMMRSVLFFPEYEDDVLFIGNEAIDQYIESGLDGRLIQSIKSALSSRWFISTVICKEAYRVEDFVSLILTNLKKKADHMVGQDVKAVVLGRPAVFSDDSDKEAVAVERLLAAARMAGFREINLQIEPIAAALSYELTLTKPELALVVDLGGGTSDFTLMKLSPDYITKGDRSDDILSCQGVPVGGDNLDSEIMWHKLVKHFGAGTTYRSLEQTMPMPLHIMRTICDWRKIPFLRARQEREFVRHLLATSSDRKAIERLQSLIEDDIAFSLFRSIESAKCELSERESATVKFFELGINIQEEILRKEFSEMIKPELDALNQCITDVLDDAGIQPDQVNSVFITGGTSLVPCVRELLASRLGAEKIQERDSFLSVAKGLALSSKLFF